MKISVSLENGWLVEEEAGIVTITDSGGATLAINNEDRASVIEAIQICGQQGETSERRGRVAKTEPKKADGKKTK